MIFEKPQILSVTNLRCYHSYFTIYFFKTETVNGQRTHAMLIGD